MCQLTTSKSGHHLDQNFVNLKDRIKSIVYCFDDIKKIAPEDVAAIFQLRDWPVLSYEANLAKIMRFCVLEYLPDCETSLNPVNSNLVNFLLLKRLHRRILATNEKSGRTGPSNYEGVARFACEFRYIQGARMVCAMAEVATTENILDVIKKKIPCLYLLPEFHRANFLFHCHFQLAAPFHETYLQKSGFPEEKKLQQC